MSVPVTVVGFVGSQPEIITTAKNLSICRFRFASSSGFFNRETQTWVDHEPDWFTVSVFRELGENAHRSIAKGDRLVVHGKLRVEAWERNGKSGTNVEIDAEALGHDLRWGVSTFTKHQREEESQTQAHTETNGWSTPMTSHENREEEPAPF